MKFIESISSYNTQESIWLNQQYQLILIVLTIFSQIGIYTCYFVDHNLFSLLMKVKEESEKAGLKLSIQKTKIVASRPITSWQIDGKQWKQWQILFSWAPESLQMVAAAMKLKDASSLDSILKSRDITLQTKVHLVNAMVFPVVRYICKSWTIKKVERRRIDVFELWCWRRLLRILWTARRSNQSILKEISTEYSWKDWCWSWNSNTLATWCKELTLLKRPWCWERLKAGGEGDNRGRDGWMASLTQ